MQDWSFSAFFEVNSVASKICSSENKIAQALGKLGGSALLRAIK